MVSCMVLKREVIFLFGFTNTCSCCLLGRCVIGRSRHITRRLRLIIGHTFLFGRKESEFLHMYFGSIPGIAIFALPLSVFKPTLNIYLITFAQIFFANLGSLVSYNDIMPICIGDAFACLFACVRFICSNRKPTYAPTAFKIMHLYLVA